MNEDNREHTFTRDGSQNRATERVGQDQNCHNVEKEHLDTGSQNREHLRTSTLAQPQLDRLDTASSSIVRESPRASPTPSPQLPPRSRTNLPQSMTDPNIARVSPSGLVEEHQRSDSSATGQHVHIPMQKNPREEKDQTDSKEMIIERICPRVNCMEKIIICFDLSQEMEKVTFRSRAGDKFAPLQLVKRALGMFLHSKKRIDKKHQYALMILHEEAQWMHDFTSDPNDIISIIEDLDRTHPCETCDIASIFDIIARRVPLPKMEDPSILPPPYIVRILFIYGRSYCIPRFESRETWKILRSSPHFFIDAYYVHEQPSSENQCEDIFETICGLDTDGLSYILEVSRNPTKLYDCMAQLLAHPLQRPFQKDIECDIEPLQEDGQN